jgi:protocatechuate 3,4-dioxygenase beta subunit
MTRRDAIRTLAAAAAGVIVAPGELAEARQSLAGIPSCVVVPSQTEGPYFIDERLRRPDLRSDPATGAIKAGTPLALRVTVSRMDGGQCAPLPNAIVDVWQCDAAGEYSGVLDQGRRFDTRGQKFLRGYRGYQVTDRDGRAEFITIYPGWYPGRTVHIHFKVRTSMSAGRAGEFTSQWYFDDAVTDAVFAQGPYAAKGARPVRNDRDNIFRRGGRELMLNLARTASGYQAAFDLAVRL